MDFFYFSHNRYAKMLRFIYNNVVPVFSGIINPVFQEEDNTKSTDFYDDFYLISDESVIQMALKAEFEEQKEEESDEEMSPEEEEELIIELQKQAELRRILDFENQSEEFKEAWLKFETFSEKMGLKKIPEEDEDDDEDDEELIRALNDSYEKIMAQRICA